MIKIILLDQVFQTRKSFGIASSASMLPIWARSASVRRKRPCCRKPSFMDCWSQIHDRGLISALLGVALPADHDPFLYHGYFAMIKAINWSHYHFKIQNTTEVDQVSGNMSLPALCWKNDSWRAERKSDRFSDTVINGLSMSYTIRYKPKSDKMITHLYQITLRIYICVAKPCIFHLWYYIK